MLAKMLMILPSYMDWPRDLAMEIVSHIVYIIFNEHTHIGLTIVLCLYVAVPIII